MTNDKAEPAKVAATEDHESHEAGNALLHCVYSQYPVEHRDDRTYGPWDVTKVYEGDKSGEDWFASSIVNRQSGPESYWAKIGGVTFDDLIQPKDTGHPGEDTVFAYRSDGKPMTEYKKGSPEYDAVVDLVHNKIDFYGCAIKE